RNRNRKQKSLRNSHWNPSPTISARNQPMYAVWRTASTSTNPLNGLSQPPKKNTAVNADIRIMLAYSARKNSANAMPEYSTWKPATISDSPSATSKGARLVSATPEMKYTINSGNSQNQFQDSSPPSWV